MTIAFVHIFLAAFCAIYITHTSPAYIRFVNWAEGRRIFTFTLVFVQLFWYFKLDYFILRIFLVPSQVLIFVFPCFLWLLVRIYFMGWRISTLSREVIQIYWSISLMRDVVSIVNDFWICNICLSIRLLSSHLVFVAIISLQLWLFYRRICHLYHYLLM